MARIRFRPHHFLCALGFQGKGYSPRFVEHFQKIVNDLRDPAAGDQLEIEVTEGLDSVCGHCPNQEGGVCASHHKVSRMDRAHADVLGLKATQVLTWGQAKKLLAEKMTAETFDSACTACAWKSMGACKNALETLKAK